MESEKSIPSRSIGLFLLLQLRGKKHNLYPDSVQQHGRATMRESASEFDGISFSFLPEFDPKTPLLYAVVCDFASTVMEVTLPSSAVSQLTAELSSQAAAVGLQSAVVSQK